MAGEHTIEGVVAQLLQLVDSTCEHERIPYILWNETARTAKLTGELVKGEPRAQIAVMASDASRLSDALNRIDPEKFFCESWLTNSKYPTFSMRFNALETTSVNYREMTGFECYGIHVDVTLLATDLSSNAKTKFSHMKELGWCLNRQPYRIAEFRSSGLRTLAKCVMSAGFVYAASLGGLRKNYGSRLFDKRCADSAACLNAETAIAWNPKHAARAISLRHITDRTKVTVSGGEYSIPSDFDGFMESCDQAFWEEGPVSANSGIGTWTSAELPYRDSIERFRSHGGTSNVSLHLMIKYALKLRQGSAARKKLADYRNKVRAVGDEVNIRRICGERRAAVLERYAVKDYPALKVLFREYSEALSLSRNRNLLPLTLDEDLQLIYIETMIACGRKKVAYYALQNARCAWGKEIKFEKSSDLLANE